MAESSKRPGSGDDGPFKSPDKNWLAEIFEADQENVGVGKQAPPDPRKQFEMQFAIDQFITGTSDIPLRKILAKLNGADWRTGELKMVAITDENRDEWQTVPGSFPHLKPEQLTVDITRRYGMRWPSVDDAGISAVVSESDPREDRFGYNPTRPLMADVGQPQLMAAIIDEPFRYNGLDPSGRQIRLMRAGAPTKGGLGFQILLDVVDLADNPPVYHALSYVWGPPEKLVPIACNQRILKITPNLAQGIVSYFRRNPGTLLWADGICINQEDVEERSQQVMLMGEIYDRAARVFAQVGEFAIWDDGKEQQQPLSGVMDRIVHLALNHAPTYKELTERVSAGNYGMGAKSWKRGSRIEHDTMTVEAAVPTPFGGNFAITRLPSGQFAFSLMNYLSGIWMSGGRARAWDRNDSFWSTSDVPTLLGETDIQRTLMDFWSQDWFNRAWILQEAVLPSKVVLMYRDAVSNLDNVLDFWYRAQGDVPLEMRRGPLSDGYGRFIGFSQARAMKILREARHKAAADRDKKTLLASLNMSLLDLLVLTRTNSARDARDKVYSLLGLAQDDVATSIVPDYAEANTADMMFVHIAEAYIRRGRAVDLLGQGGISKNYPNLPSWAPDWTMPVRQGFNPSLYDCLPFTVPSVKLAEDSKKAMSSNDQGPSILVRGVSIDVISRTAVPWLNYTADQFAHPLGIKIEENPPHVYNENCRWLIYTTAVNFAKSWLPDLETDERERTMARTMTADCNWQQKRIGDDQESFSEAATAYWALSEPYEGPLHDSEAAKEFSENFTPAHGCPHIWMAKFDEEDLNKLQEAAWPFETALQTAAKGGQFAVSEQGYACLTRADAEVGDLLVAFEGFPMPFVLRSSTPDQTGPLKLVGNAYVHGIMDGELVCGPVGTGPGSLEACTGVDKFGKRYSVRTKRGVARFSDFVIV